jgi:hypothetical protein
MDCARPGDPPRPTERPAGRAAPPLIEADPDGAAVSAVRRLVTAVGLSVPAA